jgi:biotin carboxyl carrier protein
VEVVVDGWRFELEVEPAGRAALRERASRDRKAMAHGGAAELRAIIPGRVIAVSVAPGDPVSAGQQLLVVEAMKMQNEVRTPLAGIVERLAVAEGQTIELGDLLVVIGAGG